MKFILAHDEARRRAMQAIASAPAGHVVVVKKPTRSLEQNAKFHAVCQNLAGREWAGKPRSAMEWKVLLVSGHAVATDGSADIVDGLEGEVVNLRESTAAMTKARGASLIDYAESWLT